MSTSAVPSANTTADQIVKTSLDRVTAALQEPLTEKEATVIKTAVAEIGIELIALSAKDTDALHTQLRDENRIALEQALEQWKNDQKPPTKEEIQLMVSQEYIEFDIPVKTSKGMETFKLIELPSEVEMRFYDLLKKNLTKHIKEFNALEMDLSEKGPVVAKLEKVMDLFPPAIDVIAEAVAISLNPFNEREDKLDTVWVKRHFSNSRMLNVMLAQAEVNRMRDFFSQLFRNSRQLIKT